MTLISRVASAGARIAWSGITEGFQQGERFTVINQQGGAIPFVKSLASQLYQDAKKNLTYNIQSLKKFYLEDLKRQFLEVSMYQRLDKVEWSDHRLWEVRIEGLPKPFNGFTPATNTTLSAISVNLGTFNIGNTSWQYISDQGTRTISITFNDDVTGTMEEFLYQWMDEISGRKTGGVVPIEKAGKIIKFRKVSRSKLLTTQADLYCVPQGILNIDKGQDSNAQTIDITFAVLGIQRHRVDTQFPYRDMAQIAAVTTANLARRNKYSQAVKTLLNRL